MILIKCARPTEISKFFASANISPARVLFNAPLTPDVKVIVTVGGDNAPYLHCFVQQHAEVPIIACLDPLSRNVFADLRLRAFITLALRKAAAIDSGTALPYSVPAGAITVAATVGEINALAANPPLDLSIDIECWPDLGELTCIGFAWATPAGPRALVVPFASDRTSYWSPSDERLAWLAVAALLGSNSRKIFQNYIFDTTVLSKHGLHTAGPIVDTMVAAHLIQPELDKNLADLARINLWVEPWKGVQDYSSNPTLWHYNGLDAIYTLLILQQQERLLQDSPLWRELYHDLPTMLLRITERGVAVDHAALEQMRADFEARKQAEGLTLVAMAQPLLRPKRTWKLYKGSFKRAAHLTLKEGDTTPWTPPDGPLTMGKHFDFPIYSFKEVPVTYNPRSGLHNKEALVALGCRVAKRRGKTPIDDLALQKLWDKHRHPFIAALRSYRTWDKLISTYCNVTLDDAHRLRFVLKIVGTVGARFSSSATHWGTGFNIQNLPKQFRKIIVPSSLDYVIMNMDFKQADPHVVGWIAGEAKMIELMDNGGDLHAYTGSAIAGRDITCDPGYNKETSIDRKFGKAANNALNYGAGVGRFQDMLRGDLGLEIAPAEAGRIINAYFALWTNIKKWHSETEAQIAKTRRLTTPMGRTRFFYGELTDKLVKEALNYVPQSTVADALNMAWVRFARTRTALRIHDIAQCHDSLTFEVHKDDLAEAQRLLAEAVASVTFEVHGRKCSFTADFSSGPSWGEQK